jgi:hypothetical protein
MDSGIIYYLCSEILKRVTKFGYKKRSSHPEAKAARTYRTTMKNYIFPRSVEVVIKTTYSC